MLLNIFAITLFFFIIITIGVLILHKNIFIKILCGILLLSSLISGYMNSLIDSQISKQPHNISTIEIDQVYKDNNGKYYITEKGKTDMTTLTPKEIYKGNSNYVIRYEYPNMTNSQSLLAGKSKIEYDLILKDLNVKYLPTFK